MGRQYARPLLWLVLLLAIGTIEVLRILPLMLARLGVRGLLTLATVIVLWSSGLLSPLYPFAVGSAGFLGPAITPWWIGGAAVAVATRGLRSATRRRLWRRLRARG